MAIYFVIAAILLIGSLIEAAGRSRRLTNGILCVVTAMLTLFIGLRFNTGADWSLYISQYDHLQSWRNYNDWEMGFYVLMQVFHVLHADYYVLQFFIAAFVMGAAAYFFRKHTDHPVFCLSLFYFFFYNSLLFAQSRQALAVALLMFSMDFILERRLLPFCVMIWLASMFHFTAVIAFPLYFCTTDWKKTVKVVVLSISEVFALLPSLISATFAALMPYMPALWSSRMDMYMANTDFSGGKEFNSGIYTLVAFALIIFMIFYINPKSRKEVFTLNALVVAMAIKNISFGFAILERFQPYYLVFGMIAYTYLFAIRIRTSWQNLYFRLVTCVLLMAFFFMPYVTILTSEAKDHLTGRAMNYSLVPYYNVINHPDKAEGRKDWCER